MLLQVMQRGLPRPDILTALQEPPSLSSVKGSPLESAEALLQAELISLLHYEAAKFPIKKKKGKRKRGEPEDSVPLGPLGPWEDFSVSFLYGHSNPSFIQLMYFFMQIFMSLKHLTRQVCLRAV